MTERTDALAEAEAAVLALTQKTKFASDNHWIRRSAAAIAALPKETETPS